jgi:succinate dehydrogenase / fumarate reductase membrane anchor subunit
MIVGGELGRVLGAGSANHGVAHWWEQRVTAAGLVPLAVWFLVSLLFIPQFDYATVAHWISRSWNAVLLVSLVLLVARHSYLGVRVVVEDYIRPPGARIVTLLLFNFAHVIIAAAGVFAILKVAFGTTSVGSGA